MAGEQGFNGNRYLPPAAKQQRQGSSTRYVLRESVELFTGGDQVEMFKLQIQLMVEGLALSKHCPYNVHELWEMPFKRLQQHKEVIDFKDALDIAAKLDAHETPPKSQ